MPDLRCPPLLFLAALLALAGCAMRPSPPGDGQSTLGYADLRRIRALNGLAPVAPDALLEKAAAEQAGYMATAAKMAHTTAESRDFVSRMQGNGIETPAAENVAYAADVGRVFAMWEASAPHRRNIVDPRFAHYGLASAPDGKGKRYWALVLGR